MWAHTARCTHTTRDHGAWLLCVRGEHSSLFSQLLGQLLNREQDRRPREWDQGWRADQEAPKQRLGRQHLGARSCEAPWASLDCAPYREGASEAHRGHSPSGKTAVPILSLPRAKAAGAWNVSLPSQRETKNSGRHSRDSLALLHPQDSPLRSRTCLQETARSGQRAGLEVTDQTPLRPRRGPARARARRPVQRRCPQAGTLAASGCPQGDRPLGG